MTCCRLFKGLVTSKVHWLHRNANITSVGNTGFFTEKKISLDVNSLIDAVYELQDQSHREEERLYKWEERLNSEGESCHSGEFCAPSTKPEIEEECSSSESEDDAEYQRTAVINQGV